MKALLLFFLMSKIVSALKMSSEVERVMPSRIKSSFSLLLGSGSKSRRDILKAHGFDFTVVKADIDEKALGDRTLGANPETLVSMLAHAKADAIVKGLPSVVFENKSILLTADQVVVHENKILEKPSSIDEARKFINLYSNDCCSTVGSLVLTDLTSMKRVGGVERATIYFKPFPEAVIQDILDEGEVMHCAGGLMVEHRLLQPFVDRIEGTQNSLMGLSIDLLYQLLEQLELPPSDN